MTVQEFITQSIERAGGAVETRAPNLLDVLLPTQLESLANNETLLAVALDTDVLLAEPRAELGTIGSPFMDHLLDLVTRRGTTSLEHLAVERPRTKALREEVERELIFSHCRVRYDDAPPEVLLCYTAQFNFKVTFLSDERREHLYVIPVNLWSNQVNFTLAERLASLPSEPVKPPGLPEAPHVGMAEAYATASAALRRLVDEETARHQARIRRRFAVDLSRTSDYYTQVAEELSQRREHESDPKRAQALDGKLEAARSEREHKLRELGEHHRLRRRAQLTSARLLSQPKTFFRVLLDRGRVTRTLTLSYDSLLERLEPPECESCRSETTRLHVSGDAQLLCPTCAESLPQH